MYFSDWWRKLVDKKPKLVNPEAKVEIKVSEFKKLLQKSYENGYKEGRSISPPKPWIFS